MMGLRLITYYPLYSPDDPVIDLELLKFYDPMDFILWIPSIPLFLSILYRHTSIGVNTV